MGFLGFVRGLFVEKAVRLDYITFSNERLIELWIERADLTEEARSALLAEASRRAIVLPQEGGGRREPAEDPFARIAKIRERDLARRPVVERMEGPPVVALPPGVVVLRTSGRRAVLCLLPLAAPDLSWTERFGGLEAFEVEAIVAFNQGAGGVLPTSWFASRFGIPAEQIFFLGAERTSNSGPSDPGGEPLGQKMPKRLDRGFLRLGPVTDRPDTLVASWSDPNDEVDARVLIGPEVRFEDVASRRASVAVGGLAVPEPTFLGLLDAVMTLREVVLLLDVKGVVPWAEGIAHLGINVSTVVSEVQRPKEAIPLESLRLLPILAAIDAGDWDRVTDLARDLDSLDFETVTTVLLLRDGGEAAALRLMDIACQNHPRSGVIFFGHGAVAFLRGDVDQAIVSYTRATEAQESEPRAFANLAAIYRRRGEGENALRCAEAAHRAMPSDPISVQHRLGSLLLLGRGDEGRALLAATSSVLGPETTREWEAHIREGSTAIVGADTFPHLARPAYESACAFRDDGRKDEALALLRRCIAFQPSHTEGRLELGTLLSELGRDADAEAVYTEGIALACLAGEAAILRFNRGNARARRGNLDAAKEDLLMAASLLPSWWEPKANLAGIAIEEGDREGAERILKELREAKADPDLVEKIAERLRSGAPPAS